MQVSKRRSLRTARRVVEVVAFYAALFALLIPWIKGEGWEAGLPLFAYILLGGHAFGAVTHLLSGSLFFGRAMNALYPGIVWLALISIMPGTLLVMDSYHGNAWRWFAGWSLLGVVLYCALWLEICNLFNSKITGLTVKLNSSDLRFARWVTIIFATVFLGWSHFVGFSKIAAAAMIVMTLALALLVVTAESKIRTTARTHHQLQ